MAEPIGWSSMRSSLHYKSVFPSLPDTGMQVTLHKNLAKRLQPKEASNMVNQHNIEMARRILHRQRVALRLFSGSRLNLKGSTPHETSSRLHRQPMRQQTCPEGFYMDNNADAYSGMRSEASTLLTEASLYGPPRESVTRESALPALPEVGRGMSTIPGSARSDLETSPRYAIDPQKHADTRGYLVKLNKPIVYKKKYTHKDVQNIVKRLTDYNPQTHPAESKGVDVVTEVPRQSMTKIKKCTAEEVQEIVERLYKFDDSRFPAESKNRPKVYSGTPRMVQTAPAEVSRQLSQLTPAPVPSIPPLTASSQLLETEDENEEQSVTEENTDKTEKPEEPELN